MDTTLLPEFPKAPLPIAISECLVGGEVRFDGGHKRSSSRSWGTEEDRKSVV